MADVQRILIEFAADTQELDSALTELEKLGQIDKQASDSFKSANKALADRVKIFEQLYAKQGQTIKGGKEVEQSYKSLASSLSKIGEALIKGASGEVVEGFLQGIDDALKEAGASADTLGNKLAETSGTIPQATDNVKSLRSELKALTDLINSGNLTGNELLQAKEKAAQLTDQIADTRTEIRNLASDTRAIDTLVDATNAVAGGFQIVQGAAALFGEENEDLQKTLVQLTAVMSVANGLQQVGNLLQKESALVLGVTTVQQKALVLSKTLEGAVESKNVIIRTAAIATQKALNLAMAANPAGLLVTAIVALGAALFAFTRQTEDATEAQIKLNEAETESIKLNNQLAALRQGRQQRIIESKEKELEILKAQGATEEQLAQKRVEIDKQRKLFADAEAGLAGDNLARLEQLEAKERQLLETKRNISREAIADGEKGATIREAQLKLIDSEIAKNAELLSGVKARLDAQSEATQALKLSEAELAKVQSDNAKKAQEETQKAIETNRQLRLQQLADDKAVLETRLLKVNEGTQEELQLRAQIIAKESQIQLASLSGTENTEAQRNLIIERALKEQQELRDRYSSTTKGPSRKDIDEANAIITEGLKEQNAIEQSYAQIRINNAKDDEAKLQAEKLKLEADAEGQRIDARERFKDNDKRLAVELELINSNLNKAKEEADKAYEDKQQAAREKRIIEEQQAAQQIAEFYISAFQQAADFAFEQGRIQRETELSGQLDKLNAQKEAELNNKRLTEDQKIKINEKYAKQEAKLKEDAFKKQKEADKVQAVINGALGITKSIATLGPPVPPNIAGILGVASVLLSTALQVAAIDKQPIPKFAKGVINLQGPGTSTSDSILARLSKGESVMTAKETKDFMPLLKGIRNGSVDPKMAGLFADFGLKPITKEAVSASSESFSIDYKKLSKAVTDELGYGIEELIQVNIAQKKMLDSINGKEQVIKLEQRWR